MGIERLTFGPEIGFFQPSVYDTFGFCDLVKAGDTIYCGGIVPLRGEITDIEVVGPGDFREQYAWVLDTIAKLFRRAGARFPEDVVEVTVMVKDMNLLSANADVFTATFGDVKPALTYVGVAQLFHPEQLIEIGATAYVGS